MRVHLLPRRRAYPERTYPMLTQNGLACLPRNSFCGAVYPAKLCIFSEGTWPLLSSWPLLGCIPGFARSSFGNQWEPCLHRWGRGDFYFPGDVKGMTQDPPRDSGNGCGLGSLIQKSY